MACSGTARTWPMLDIFWVLAQSYYQVTGQMGYGHLWYKNQRIKCRQEKLSFFGRFWGFFSGIISLFAEF
jgi:hypothetical protein